MFRGTKVSGVYSDNPNVTDMGYMFSESQATNLDLTYLDTSNVTNMSGMFSNSKATSLKLSNFDTSKVINMSNMFELSKATILDLSSFDTSSVHNMFFVKGMFRGSQAKKGYARTQEDIDRFNNYQTEKPSELTFEVKSKTN